ncbi:MAG: YdeI/OmpD-associated family protein [Salibacteraceae bacterium]
MNRIDDLRRTTRWESRGSGGPPCYTYQGKNVIGLAAFKAYFGLWFHNGSFLSDEAQHLTQASEKTKGLRQWRFKSLNEINGDLVKAYIHEALINQQKGKEIKAERRPLVIPPELNELFRENIQLRNAFQSLSTGNQREFAEYISEAKRQETKRARCEKIIPVILSGAGLNDKYR